MRRDDSIEAGDRVLRLLHEVEGNETEGGADAGRHQDEGRGEDQDGSR